MSIRAQLNEPSTIADVLRNVKQAFSALADATPIFVGKKYLKDCPGNAPKIIFAPEYPGSGGHIGPALQIGAGSTASQYHGCALVVAGRESTDDIERYANAYALLNHVVSCINACASGKIEWGSCIDDSPTDTNGLGARLLIVFTYRRDIINWAERLKLAASTDDPSKAIDKSEHPTGVAMNPTSTPQE